MNPCDYSLCTDTVTVYRQETDGVLRQVVKNCLFAPRGVYRDTVTGAYVRKPFLLVIPEESGSVQLQDRIFPGEGPERIRQEQLALLHRVQRCTPYYFEGRLCHWEAEG